MTLNKQSNFLRKVAAGFVHFFTALGAVMGVFCVQAIYTHKYVLAFWFMGIAIMIDAVDGTLARKIAVKKILPQIDGALLDNIVDYFNYVIVPVIFLLMSSLLTAGWREITACIVVLTSAYQFCQIDAKTRDHFFKGFPCYWNIIIFYLFFWQIDPWINCLLIWILAFLVFVPIKYVYPSRLDYLTHNPFLRGGMLIATLIWGFSTLGLLWIYPNTHWLLVFLSMSYLILYVLVSLYRTFIPLRTLDSPISMNIKNLVDDVDKY